ncbi:MAG: nitroreductase family deazaflavin-dependent oxidoreductase [Candidatus Binatia bacterium]
MAATKNAVVELFWKIHPKLYRWTGGRFGGRLMGLPVLLLTTRGRRSGEPRTKALTYLPRGDDFIVIASYLGEPKHPAWWLNLTADPEAEVLVRGETVSVRSREAEGEERTELWREVVARTPDYDEYRRRTQRRIPVIVLERRQ